MKKNHILTFILMLAMGLFTSHAFAQKQMSIHFEDGKSLTTSNYTIAKGTITADGTSYSKEEILFINLNGRMKIMNYETGKLIQLKKRFVIDPQSPTGLGKIYAAKYYNEKTGVKQQSAAYTQLSQNSEFTKSYDDFVKKIKSGNTLSVVGASLSVLALVILLI